MIQGANVQRSSPHPAPLAAEVREGLQGSPKKLPPKLFYDAEGARLFERICELPEYYLTRAETEILRERGAQMATLAGPGCTLIEYGSGSGVKSRLLLDRLQRPSGYVPIDVSREQLVRLAAETAASHPGLSVHPVWADYTRPFSLPTLPPEIPRVAAFLGSTIGNFTPLEAADFLRRVARGLGKGGVLLLGVDRRKDPAVLNAAYNDSQGLTAAFNLNVLTRLNREFDADFIESRFRHRAFFDAEASRIEMHLESLVDQRVRVADVRVSFEAGETIWTESSYKYDRVRLDQLAAASGFTRSTLWADARERFWIAGLTVA